MADLVTLAELKAHLRLSTPEGDPEDPDLQAKLDAAEQTVLDYLKQPDATVFEGDASVRAAVLIQAGLLYRFRGDDEIATGRSAEGELNPTVVALLYRKRDPALA